VPRLRPELAAELATEIPLLVNATVLLQLAVADQLGVPVVDLHCLALVQAGTATTPTQIAERLGMTTGAVTKMLDRMQAERLVNRVPNPDDRRGVLVEARSDRAEELARLWRALDGLPVACATALALKLVICTGVRPGEAAGARWAELEGVLWTIPAERTKSARPHAVPLPPLAQQVVAEAQGLGGAAHLFPSPRRPGEPMRRMSLSQALARAQASRQASALGVSDLRPHDLRRSVATGLAALGVQPHVVEEVLGHATITIPLDIYSHVLPDIQERAVDRLGILLS